MSVETKYVVLNLEGSLQSWGFDSKYNRRDTGLMPTKSAIAGMCGAAIGLSWGSDESNFFHEEFSKLKMISLTINKDTRYKSLSATRMQDYHIVQNSRQADGKIKNSHITYRQYLTDAVFGVLLYGNSELIDKISQALQDPCWGIWLGRKSCIPSSPVFIGTYLSKEDALQSIIGNEPIEKFTRQEDVENFSDGTDSILDQTITSSVTRRNFILRRVKLIQGTNDQS
jgi:CRISPR system Cascade subunit CasD